ncbi:MAG: ATP-binding protein [Chloroflexi bacterium]|nr:ATP-binding protein [Chloroflexota bacterium]
MPQTESINIRPGVSILSVLRHLNYKPWYAMAEFVDNSLQSYLDNKDVLERLEGRKFKAEVSISLDNADRGSITIRDNVAGIHENDYARAFRPAAIPPNRAGLSEFGMGMKSAACWFAKRWSVRTSSLGESFERTVFFDVDRIVHDNLEELLVNFNPASEQSHFTEVTLIDLYRKPHGRTIGKIKQHLASIYRVFIRDGLLELTFDGEMLSYPEPKILCAPYFKDETRAEILWKKDIDFDFGGGLEVRGFAALLETGSVSGAGFSLFRNSRVIEGSGDDGYRPEYIFKKSNSYTYQRLFGELHLTGFDVSHTKDGFQWEENEEEFLQLLKEHLEEKSISLISQAEGYRKRPPRNELKKAAESANKRTAENLEQTLPPVLGPALEAPPDHSPVPRELPTRKLSSKRVIDLVIKNENWRIVLELTNDPAIGDWIELCDQLIADYSPSEDGRVVGIRLSLAHPFMARFAGTDDEKIEGLLRVGVAIVLAEITVRSSGVRYAGTFKRFINSILREALSQP